MKISQIPLDKAYVITLPKNSDRLASVQRQFESLGLNVDVFTGIYPKQLGIAHTDPKFSQGMVGCFLSHYMIFREAVAQGWECFAVFEDDALFVPGFEHLFSKAWKNVPEDWQFIWLGYTIHDHVDRTKIIRHNSYWITTPSHWGTQAYMVRGKEAIAKILSDLETMRDQIDLQLIGQTLPNLGIRQYAIYPSAVSQSGAASDVQVERTAQNINGQAIQDLWT